MITSTRNIMALIMVCLLCCLGAGLTFAEDISIENFDNMTPAELSKSIKVNGDNLGVSLIKTDERAGIQNLLLSAYLDPANPDWNHIRINFPMRVHNPHTLTFWYRGDKVAQLYLILEASDGTRTDITIGGNTAPNQWTQANISLRHMHLPHGVPPMTGRL